MQKNIVFLLIILTVFFVGCSKTVDDTEDSKDYSVYFHSEKLEFPDEVISGSNLEYYGEKLLVECFSKGKYENEYGILDRKKMTLQIDLSTGEQTLLSNNEDIPEIFYVGDKRYEVISVIGDSAYESVTINEYSGEKLKNTYDAAELFGIDISKLKVNLAGEGGFKLLNIGEYNGSPVFVSNLGVACGTRLYQTKDEFTAAMFGGETLVIIYENNNSSKALSFDFETFEPTDIIFPDKFLKDMSFELITVEGYEVAAVISDGIYGFYHNSDGEFVYELILDFVGSDIAGSSLGDIVAVSAYEFWMVEYDYYASSYDDGDYISIWKLTAIANDEYVPKTELSIACVGTVSQKLQSEVVKFNRTNDDFRIKFNVINREGNEDIEALMDRFKAELVSNPPDAVIVNNIVTGIDISDIERQGYFTDLYELMDNAGFDKNNLLDCQKESFTMKNSKTGKDYLPYIALSGYVSTLVSETSDFEGNVTIGDILDIIDDGKIPFYSTGAETFRKNEIINLLEYDLDEFINGGEFKFDSELFKRIISTYRDMGELSGEPIFSQKKYTMLGNFSGFVTLKRDFENYNIAGYPGNSIIFSPNEMFGIFENCEHKDILFDFLATLMSDECQVRTARSQIPVFTKSGLKKYLSEADEYYGFTGRLMVSGSEPLTKENSSIFNYGGDVLLVTLDENLKNDIFDIINNARAEESIKTEIKNIIYEEISVSHNSVDEICEYISDRVSTLWSERN